MAATARITLQPPPSAALARGQKLLEVKEMLVEKPKKREKVLTRQELIDGRVNEWRRDYGRPTSPSHVEHILSFLTFDPKIGKLSDKESRALALDLRMEITDNQRHAIFRGLKAD